MPMGNTGGNVPASDHSDLDFANEPALVIEGPGLKARRSVPVTTPRRRARLADGAGLALGRRASAAGFCGSRVAALAF